MQDIATVFQKIKYWSAIVLVFTLPLPDRKLNVLTVVFGGCWLMEILFSGRFLHPSVQKRYLSVYTLLGLWLLMAVSVFYSANVDYACRVLVKRLTFPVLALLAFFYGNRERTVPDPFMKAFILGSLFSLAGAVVYPYVLTRVCPSALADAGGWNLFLCLEYVRPTEIGMAGLFSMLFAVYLKKEGSWQHCVSGWLFQTMFLLYGAFLFVLMWKSGSRMTMLMVPAMVGILLVYDMGKRSRMLAISALVVIFSGVVLLFQVHPRFSSIRPEAIHFSSDFHLQDNRIGLWYAGRLVLEEDHNLLHGVGAGDVRAELMKRYELSIYQEQETINHLYDETHIHNNFMQMALETGIPAVLLLLFVLVWPVIHAKGRSARLLTGAMVLLWVVRMTVDCPFMNLREIVGFSFSLLLFASLDTSRKDVNHFNTVSDAEAIEPATSVLKKR